VAVLPYSGELHHVEECCFLGYGLFLALTYSHYGAFTAWMKPVAVPQWTVSLPQKTITSPLQMHESYGTITSQEKKIIQYIN